tara:strand:- start:7059 stop:9905 length:2847 start_codon:yes stop_codon:yes gene_type:complete
VSRLEKYADWLIDNKDKKDTEDFKKVADAYKLLREQPEEGGFESLLKRTKGKTEDDDFDYDTGAPAGIRALVSFGETEEEKEAILLKKIGKDGYTKDSRGRLALTPIGQKKSGMQPTDKNVILEERGVSLRDFADFAGILPEAVGSVAGAIAGSPGVFTGALGAGAGAAAGQAIEEGIETLLGVQKQTLPEVGKDLAKEAAIAGAVDFATVGLFRAGRSLVGGAGRKLGAGDPADPLRGKRLVEEGYMPSLERLGAPSFLGYSQKFAEGATKDSTRLVNNLELTLLKRNKIIDETTTLDEAGQIFSNLSGKEFDRITKQLDNARQQSMNAVRESVNFLGKSVDEGFDVGTETLDAIKRNFDSFNKEVTARYTKIDNVLKESEFNTDKIININALDQQVGKLKEEFGTLSGLHPSINNVIKTINDTKRLNAPPGPDGNPVDIFTITNHKANFTQLNNQRRLINEALFDDRLTSLAREQLFEFRDIYDNLLSVDNISTLRGIGVKQKAAIKQALKDKKVADDYYKVEKQKFDDLRELGVIRQLNEDGIKNLDYDQVFSRIVQRDAPERLEAVLKATDDADFLREKLAVTFVKKALDDTKLDLMNPNRFNGMAFRNKINNLGKSGKVLFGKDFQKVKDLADTISQVGFKTINAEDLKRIVAVSPDDDVITSMQKLANASQEYSKAIDLKVIRDLNEGVMSPEDAVNYITRENITASEVGRLQQFFKNSPEQYEKIKESVIHKLLQSVDEDIFSSPSSALALKKSMAKYKSGVLEKIIGEDAFKNLKQFADDLVYLGDVGKEGSIYAATFAAHPIGKWRSNLRFKTTAKIFASPAILRTFAERGVGNRNQRMSSLFNTINKVYNATAQTTGASRQLGQQVIGEQLGETMQETKRRFSPTTSGNQLSKIQQSISQPNMASGLGQVNIAQPSMRANPILNPNPRTQSLVTTGKI